LAFITARANSVPGNSLEEKVSRLLLDQCVVNILLSVDWVASSAICNSKTILFEHHPTREAILVIANTPEYFDSTAQAELRRAYLESFDQYRRVIQNLRNRGYHVCITGHNYAGQVAMHLAQQWGVFRITLQTPFDGNDQRTARDYFDDEYPLNTFVGSSSIAKVLEDFVHPRPVNLHALTLDETVTLAQLYSTATTALQQQVQQEIEEEDDEEPLQDMHAADAAVINTEFQAINRQQQLNLEATNDIFGPLEAINAPHLVLDPDMNVMNQIPASDVNLDDFAPPPVTVNSIDHGAKLTTWTDSTRVEPKPNAVKEESHFLDYAPMNTYERDVRVQQAANGGDISRTQATPKYALPKNSEPTTDSNLLVHEQLARNVMNVQPDEAVVRIQQQATVTHKRRFLGWKYKTWTETTRRGVREERATEVKTKVVHVNTNHGPEYMTTSHTEFVQHEHIETNGHVSEAMKGRTTTEQKFYARQDGNEYEKFNQTLKLQDSTKITRNEIDQQRSEIKQTTHDGANRAQSTVEIQNVHGTSTTQSIGPTTTNKTKNKFKLVNETVKEQKVVIQKENFKDERARTETDHSTGKSTTTTTDRAEKRQAVGVEVTQTTTSTATKLRGFMTKKTTLKTKETRNYQKNNNNNTTYSEAQPMRKQVIITEAPAEGAKGYLVNEKVKVTKHEDGKEVVKVNRDLNLAAQQGLAVATSELLDRTLDMFQKYSNGKLGKGDVAKSMSELFVNVGEGYFAGHAANMLTTMESHLDALQISLITLVGGHLLRFGINWFAKPKENGGDDKSIMKMLPATEMCIDAAAAIAKSGLYYVTLGAEFAYKSPVIFGATQIISAGQQVVTALLNEKLSVKDALISVAPNVGIALVSSAASILVQKGVTCCLGAALGGTIAMTALTVIVPTIAFWATRKLLTAFVIGQPEGKELERLLKKYELKKDADISEIKKEYRKLCLEKHPDKGGSTAAFQELNGDFDKIAALHMMREIPKQKDVKKMSVFQAAYEKMRQVIAYFKKTEVSSEKLEQCFLRLDYEINKVSAESAAVGSIFAALKFPGLQQYAHKFEEHNYDDLSHLLIIADQEAEFAKLCEVCGITSLGHQSQLRVALRELKNSNGQVAQPNNFTSSNAGATN
jgi:hypothetical protein